MTHFDYVYFTINADNLRSSHEDKANIRTKINAKMREILEKVIENTTEIINIAVNDKGRNNNKLILPCIIINKLKKL